MNMFEPIFIAVTEAEDKYKETKKYLLEAARKIEQIRSRAIVIVSDQLTDEERDGLATSFIRDMTLLSLPNGVSYKELENIDNMKI